MKCKFCATDLHSVMPVQSPIIKEKVYTLYECPSCNSRFFDHNEHEGVSLDEMYEDLARNRKKFPVEFIPKPYWQHQKQLLLSLLDRSPKHVLDVGARTGDFLMHFDDAIEKTGVELSPHFCETGRKRGLTMIEDFLENISFSQKFDIVTSYAILEHLTEPMTFLKSLQDIVEPGGIVAILIPTHQSVKARLKKENWHMYSPPEHLNFYSRSMLDQFFDEHDFELRHRYYSLGGMFDLFNGVPVLNNFQRKLPALFDALPLVTKYPVYDHMFSYYQRKG